MLAAVGVLLALVILKPLRRVWFFYDAIGTSFERRIFRSRVMRGTRWTRLVAAMISSAGSLSKSKDLIERQISSVSGHV
jgi:hypothetical protein